MENLFDLYTDYLISSFGQTSAIGLSNLVDNTIKHDSITRLLSNLSLDSRTLLVSVKPLVREHQNENASLIFDDIIIEKVYTDENEIICWHWDYNKGRNIKGINLLNAFYISQKIPIQHLCVFLFPLKRLEKTSRFAKLKPKKLNELVHC